MKLPTPHKYISKILFWKYLTPLHLLPQLQPIPPKIPTPRTHTQISYHILIPMLHYTLIWVAHLAHTNRRVVHNLLNGYVILTQANLVCLAPLGVERFVLLDVVVDL